ncbi:catecholate siderophore receptor Fiu [Pseudoxanthomonas sp.]|uniref:catecholate siderophore receptor Fiu n=1 Tax=Pseudoxanthomonas sp. TaxID=1871049 RepID=UPI0026341821|nr:catecholate siderophore receptor Fiu [Pseudoxanthomonas sp.]WDS37403.1 MAG: catecholate siderophore receptor Fiu [Pseudoxanthomonas sp.]
MSHIRSRKHAPHARPLAAAALVTSLALALPALAADPVAASAGADAPQKTDRDDATTLKEIQVTSSRVKDYSAKDVSSDKFTQPLLDTPQTIQVITNDLFTEQGATNLTEALRNSPGVGTFYAGENGNTTTGDAIYMRGFDTSSSIFVDGIRDTGSISRDVFNIEQVEVEKGPAGTDTGRAAPTGSINMVSKHAFLRNAAAGTVAAGIDGQKRITGDWNQVLDAASGTALRVNVMGQDSDVPGRDKVNNKRWGIAPTLAVGLDTATRFYLDLLYVKQDNIPDGNVPTIGLPGWTPQPGLEQLAGHPVDPENFYGTRADHDDVTAQMATFRFEHDFSDALKLTNTARWGKTEQDYLLTAFMSTGGATGNIKYTDVNDLSSYTMARSTPTFKDQENTILTDQLNLRADFSTGAVVHNLVTGLEFTREEQKAYGQAVTGGTTWTPANLYNPDWNATGLTWAHSGADSEGKTTTSSAYLFDTLKFGEQFLITAGVRVDHYKTEFNSLVACGARGAPVCGTSPTGTIVPGVDADASDTLFNWKLGAVYKVGNLVSLYTNYAISQQPPGGNNFTFSTSANSLDNPNLDPQKAKTAEIGTKWNLLDERLLLSAALFQTEVTNELVQDPADTAVYYQTGKKKVSGVELSMVGKLTDNWAVTAGYTTMNTKVEEGAAVTSDGSNNLTYTPDDAFTGWSTYRLPFGLTLGGGVRYSGRMHRGTDGAVGTPTYTKSYTVWDAVATYTVNDHLDLRLNGYNLFDKDYVASINKSGYRYSPGASRTVLLSADFRF